MGDFLSQPLKVACRDIDGIRAFLSTCRYVSDQEQFGVRDHWMLPGEFEQTRQGDCDDFALWACRQLLDLGYRARFVVGSAGRYGVGHAWVSFRVRNRIFIVEPLAARHPTFPRLETLRYRPAVSRLRLLALRSSFSNTRSALLSLRFGLWRHLSPNGQSFGSALYRRRFFGRTLRYGGVTGETTRLCPHRPAAGISPARGCKAPFCSDQGPQLSDLENQAVWSSGCFT